jgi:hypothetical protein
MQPLVMIAYFKRYPKATFFYSMKSSDGHKLYWQEEALEHWLTEVVTKHTSLLHAQIKKLPSDPKTEV